MFGKKIFVKEDKVSEAHPSLIFRFSKKFSAFPMNFFDIGFSPTPKSSTHALDPSANSGRDLEARYGISRDGLEDGFKENLTITI